MIKVGIVGGTGYTGVELLRIFATHPQAKVQAVTSRKEDGMPVAEMYPSLRGRVDVAFSSPDKAKLTDCDVVFFATPHGVAMAQAPELVAAGVKVIDLAADFRMQDVAAFEKWYKLPHSCTDLLKEAAYGLPELNREAIRSAKNIANPGCFATAIQLGLLPLAKAGVLGDVYTTGITGSTGAGQGLSSTSHFSWRANNIQAYKSLQHQHINEIHQSLQQLQGNDGMYVNFVPWRGDFTRGIYISSVIDCGLPADAIKQLYKEYYQGHAFTHVSDTMIDLKQVVNTNKCLLHIEKQGTKIVVHSAIDNLLKGASGQAVQNMNLVFGLDEKAGLQLKAAGF